KDKDLHKRQEMLANMKSKANQMASTLSMSNFGNRSGFTHHRVSYFAKYREDLLGDGKNSADVMSRTSGLDNQGIVALQRQVMRATMLINQRLVVCVGLMQRAQKRLAILNKRTKGGCSCMCLLLSVVAIVILIVVAWLLIKYL
ncbi:hypothetical protein B296_00034957, partial [Ensete ventricosum]